MSAAPDETPPAPDDPVHALLEDFMTRELRGERPDFGVLLAAHPQHAERLLVEIRVWEGVRGMLDRLGNETPSTAAQAISGDHRPPSSAGDVPLLRETLGRLRLRAGSFARYTVRSEVGRGGMGAVLRVWDEDLRRHLALKVALPEGAVPAPGALASPDPRRLGRFLEEAQITAQLDHPGIVPVHELGLTHDERVYFTMKLVAGRDLEVIFELARRGAEGWSITRAAGVLLKVCEAMAYAHHKGVVHRDLKPSNVMVGGFGEVYVMDWGLARILGVEDRHDLRPKIDRRAPGSEIRSARGEARESDTDSPLLTADGTVLGTPAYMPPEQAAGRVEELGVRGDVYALGAMLYHLLAGHPPYMHEKVLPKRVLLLRLLEGPPPPLEELDLRVQPELAAIQAKAMARESGERYASMAELAEDLRAFLERRVVRAYETGTLAELRKWVARNRSLAATIAVALALLLGGSSAASLVLAGKNEALVATNDELARQSYEAAIAAADGALRAGDVAAARRYLARPLPAERGWEWLYLASLTDRSERTLFGHSRAVRCLALDSRGETIASYGDDETVRTWSFESGEELSRFTIPDPGWPHQVHFSPSGAYVASTLPSDEGEPRTLVVWETRSGAELARFPHAETTYLSAAFSPDERRLATGSEVVQVFELADGTPLWKWEPDEMVLALLFSPDGSTLAVRTREGALWLLDAADGALRHPPLARPPLQGRALAFSADGALVAAPSQNDVVQVWNARTAEPGPTLTGNTYDVWSIAFHPDGRSLLTASGDGVLRLWDLADGNQASVLLGHRYGARALFHPDGRSIVSAGHDRTLRTWSMPERSTILPSQDRTGDFRIFGSPDGRVAAVRDSESTLAFWDLERREILWSTSFDERVVPTLAFDPGGELVAIPAADGAVAIHARASGDWLFVLRGHVGTVYDLAFHPHERVLASAATDGKVCLWSLETREWIAVLDCSPAPLRTVAFDRTGERIVAAGDDARARIFSVAQRQLEIILPGTGRPIWEARFVDGDRRLATLAWNGAWEYDLHLWELGERGAQPQGLGKHDAWGRMEIVPHPDGTRFALSRASGEPLLLYDASTGAELLALRGYLGSNFGILGFQGESGDELVAYDDHGLLVSFDASRGRVLARELDALPAARELYGRVMEDELYTERVIDRLRAEQGLEAALRTTALELALDAGRDRASFVEELELALLLHEASAPAPALEIGRAMRLAELLPGDRDATRLHALALCRRGEWASARERARAARALSPGSHATLEGVLAICGHALGDEDEARTHLKALRALLAAHWYATASGAQALLAEVEARLANARAPEGRAE